MNCKIPFTKDIDFEKKVSEITSISLEHETKVEEGTLKGNFIVSGDFKSHEVSVNKEPFSYILPFEIDLTENVDVDTIEFMIEDFTYEVIEGSILRVNIDFNVIASLKEIEEEPEIQIDINISSFIPDSYIDNSSQKIEVYQNIALCRTEDDIQNVIDEIIDRYGVMPQELENLIEIARIKELCQKAGVIKVAEKKNMFTNTPNLVFYYDKNKYNPEIVDILIKKYGNDIKFSVGIEPYVTLRLGKTTDEKLIAQIKEFLSLGQEGHS